MWNRFSIQCSLGAAITVICILFVFVLTGLITPQTVYGDWDSYVHRYAIIVMGGNEPDSEQLYRWYWGDTGGMFHELISYGFTGDNIYFLSYGDSANAHPEWVDAVSTTENIRLAFQWAQTQCTANDLLYIYWVDHGSPDYFNSNNGVITHAELGTLMQPIVAKQIIGAYNPCYSGCVIDDISRLGVITVTSQDCFHPNSWGWAGMWRRALRGAPEDSIDMNGDGYISMTEAYNWIAPRSQAAGEHSMFDDNGDAVGHEWGQPGYDPDDPCADSEDGYNGKFYSLDAYCDPPNGTPVNGDVYGVWDSAGSPYYVCGDIAVPIGQQLIIEPGVEVLFMGHYKFNIYGLLRAKGTEQDSIVFTHYYPSEDSTWWGIRFDSADSPCTLQYCRIEYGEANGTAEGASGGGVFCNNSDVFIGHSEIKNNLANSFGGGIYSDFSNLHLYRCLLHDNQAIDQDGGGLFYAYNSQGSPSPLCSLVNCTFADNTANNWGGGAVFFDYYSPLSEPSSYPNVKNSIFCYNWPDQIYKKGNLDVSYSDICGGWVGNGNIDCDPGFQDDYHLSLGSCCIDAGDPNSPKDPDSTRADIGVFYFSQCRTWVVKPDHTGDAPTIQAAIDSASYCDTVLLMNGTFWGAGNRDITFQAKPIIVRSQHGTDACTLDCSRNASDVDIGIPHRGFSFHSGENSASVIEGITIIRGSTWSWDSGGGILCVASSPTIRDCRIAGNAGGAGGGVCCDNASPTIIQCRITGNLANVGGGIYCSNNSSPTLINCTISGNKANRGGGICQLDSSSPYLTRSIVWGNCASSGNGDEWYCDGTIPGNCCSDVRASGFGELCQFIPICPPESLSISADPMFCHPISCDSAPTTAGCYCIHPNSPCAPDNSPNCGLIGVGMIRGDCSRDGQINVADVIFLLNYLYKSGPAPVPLAIGDVSCDGIVNSADVVYLLNYLFAGGPCPCCYCSE